WAPCGGCADPDTLGLVGGQRMVGDELAGFGIQPLDVVLQGGRLDPPLATPSDLDGLQVAAADQCIHLSGRDVEHLGDVRKLQKSRHLLVHKCVPLSVNTRCTSVTSLACGQSLLSTGACGYPCPAALVVVYSGAVHAPDSLAARTTAATGHGHRRCPQSAVRP